MTYRYVETPFKDLLGKTLTRVDAEGAEIRFFTEDGFEYKQWHEQDCCESVYVEDVAGDWEDLIGSPLVLAAEESSDDPPPADQFGPPDSYTWTFYRLGTVKGTVVVRWLGESNGYYSESVSFQQMVPEVKTR